MPEVSRRVRPTPTTSDLANPHRGMCTFHSFNGDPLFNLGESHTERRLDVARLSWGPASYKNKTAAVAERYLPTTVAYFRWFWAELVPEKGRFDFSGIDQVLEIAAARGQTLSIRVMPYGGSPWHLPPWYERECPVVRNSQDGPAHPDHNAPDYLEHFGGLIRELGRRYDQHPLLETIDMAFVGPWGCGDFGLCEPEVCARFADVYKEAFPNTLRLCPAVEPQLPSAIATGAGWHADGFGDMRDIGSPVVTQNASWNHMFDQYPRTICVSGAQETWKKAPVFIETYFAPRYWHECGYDIDFILQQALKFHPTYFNPKYMALPERWMDKFEAFCRKLGYNFVYRQAMYDTQVKAGGKMRFQSWIENTGVAPIYYSYDFAVRLRQGDREEIMVLDGIDPRTWLPGDVWIDRQIPIPSDFKPGMVDVSAGLIDAESMEAKVSFAIRENYSDRWAGLGLIEVVPS
ncbi:MAG TPA: DUF4832 domain-containing protein [Planctomycetota bacterium]|nr:DUF4832 domain-containing protein [Planctomycetota bacterium]